MDNKLVQGKPYFTGIGTPFKQYNYLTEDKNTPVLIVGGGATGALIAHYLCENNIKCILVEKSRIAHGSTCVTTSLLQYELDDNLASLTQYTSFENGIKSYSLGEKALKDLELIITSQGNHCDYKQTDSLLFTNKSIEEKELFEEFQSRKNAGFNVLYIDSETNPFEFEMKAGILSKAGGAVLDPFKFTHQLLSNVEKRGVEIYENTCVKKVLYKATGVEAITEYDNVINCKYIICATGYDISLFTHKPYGTKYVTYNIVTNPLTNYDPQLKEVVVRDNCSPYNYLRMTNDNRFILGGEDEPYEQNIFNKEMAEKKYSVLTERLKNMLPSIRNDVNIDYKLCGEFISTRDNLGYIGQDENHKNLYYCLGYGANGLIFSILGGQYLAKLLKNQEDPAMTLFNPNRQ